MFGISCVESSRYDGYSRSCNRPPTSFGRKRRIRNRMDPCEKGCAAYCSCVTLAAGLNMQYWLQGRANQPALTSRLAVCPTPHNTIPPTLQPPTPPPPRCEHDPNFLQGPCHHLTPTPPHRTHSSFDFFYPFVFLFFGCSLFEVAHSAAATLSPNAFSGPERPPAMPNGCRRLSCNNSCIKISKYVVYCGGEKQ